MFEYSGHELTMTHERGVSEVIPVLLKILGYEGYQKRRSGAQDIVSSSFSSLRLKAIIHLL